MASAGIPEQAGEEALQFDHAEFTTAPPASVTCRACQRPIDDLYYEINQNLLCDPCRQGIEASFLKRPGFVGFVKAATLGLLAAIAGAVVHYVVGAITGWNIGLIFILVGFLVGGAVSKGSGHRGGFVYQALAVFLTYSAVAWSSIPEIVKTFAEPKPDQNVEKVVDNGQKPADEAAPAKLVANSDAGEPDKPKEAAPLAKVEKPPAAPAVVPEKDVPAPSPALLVLGVGLLLILVMVVSYAVPFLGLPQNLITLFIIFIGLQQAWRMNRKVVLKVNGPFRVGEGGLPAEGVPAHG